MPKLNPQTPILVGVGQVVRHWSPSDGESAPSPLDLQVAAARAALADSGAAERLVATIDGVVVVRSMLDSVEGSRQPFGRCANPPATLAADLGIASACCIYSVVGGDQPQALVNEAAEAIYAGDVDAVLLVGAEATAAMKQALKVRQSLDWSRSVDGPWQDRGLGPALLTEHEIANGLGAPTQTYPVFEQALRTRLGLSRDDYADQMAELWAGFSEVAAGNLCSQFPEVRSREFLKTEGRDNYRVADPYLKWHVAQDAVNQGAALILTSVGVARKLGIAPEKWVYLHGYAAAKDRPISERADLSRSTAMEAALSGALAMAGKTASDMAHIDLYSCFPCAVFLAAEALGVDWRSRACTVTGGLPFFGGPGNNYSMHAIATMAERLRAEPNAFGLVLANGGYLSKEAAGVYSATPVDAWAPRAGDGAQTAIDVAAAPELLAETCRAVIEACSVTWKKGRPSRGYVIAASERGRIIARARSGHRATLFSLHEDDVIGRSVQIVHEKGVNFIEPGSRLCEAAPADGLATRRFDHVLLERRGPVLEVTLNRPEAMNALYSAVHFELHEIWDAFERDPGLWVAIVTGAGERAFCSGNDLKVTAKGGDLTMPPTGFAGLCERFDRTKPVIAAVNGIAMGGGLEIVLACDLAVAEDQARFALPEVRVGLYAAAGGVQRLTRQIGRKAAMELILTGRHFDTAEAIELGIVNAGADTRGALAAARDLADRLLQNSPSAIRASKEALNKLEELESLQAALAANGRIFGRLMRTRDFREGVAAFAEKRQPEWSGS
ncbi:acetyl-CoA C-acetyltransferase [Sphingopyxis sp. YR583]|uniref:enoyl-CoA hydratase-related protein n=1 Tax=Sphingopyxis sp. YR583 TaxID=1881047 RepID=UPI0008A739FB|nr:enoyl-CoA hydratase-related protein [Sphingopyxis sp. YR583]SEH19227.1 acetyl-CoA C-acetyltransferase [Sphingopyxis sp. YR583]